MAHDSGELLDPAAEWEIPLATLRQAFSKHEGNDAQLRSAGQTQPVEPGG